MERVILIGGKAGEGVKEAANLFAKVLVNRGYWAFTYHDYPSLIRGGHNFSSIRFSLFPVKSPKRKADVIVALDSRSVREHLKDQKPNTYIAPL